MRKDILPQLTEHVNNPKYDPLEDRPKFMLQNCMNSGKKERSWKPKLRRLQQGDSIAQALTEKKSLGERTDENEKGYSLRPRKRPYGAISEKVGNPPSIVPTVKRNRGCQTERLIGRGYEHESRDSPTDCFGSAKKVRKSQGRTILLV